MRNAAAKIFAQLQFLCIYGVFRIWVRGVRFTTTKLYGVL